MVALAPVPADELARLQALHTYHVLDTPPDERFDVFTRLCTWIYRVPIAAINLIDADHTFFKSIVGFPAYQPRRLTSICAHAVGIGQPILEIPDLADDSRFSDHPLVSQGIRFYAGALLHASSGHPLGTLCICDREPRTLDAQERDMLLELVRGVGSVMDLHRSSLWLLRAASEDSLTGLCNRRVFIERLQTAVQETQPDRSCVLLCLDLDGFKTVNDTYGHAAGDAVLREVGRRLTASVRTGDVVARLGGDEFAILLNDTSTTACAEQLSWRVLEALATPCRFEGLSLPIRTSIGIAACSFTDRMEPAGLMRCADTALYEAKKAGRGCYRIFQSGAAASPLVLA